MTFGMSEFSSILTQTGIRDKKQLEKYCYYVAGTVGELLTNLFRKYTNNAFKNKEVNQLAISFGELLTIS